MTEAGKLDRTSGRELHMVRTFAAPAAMVFDAWTNPDIIIRWMCPRDFTVIVAEVEPRSGGAWRAHIRSPGGDDMWHSGIYWEFTPPRRLVFTHIWSGAHPNPGHETLITIDLVEREGRTEMTFHQAILVSQEACDDHHGGWSEAFEHLAGQLTETTST